MRQEQVIITGRVFMAFQCSSYSLLWHFVVVLCLVYHKMFLTMNLIKGDSKGEIEICGSDSEQGDQSTYALQ